MMFLGFKTPKRPTRLASALTKENAQWQHQRLSLLWGLRVPMPEPKGGE